MLAKARKANNKFKAPKGNAMTNWSRARIVGTNRIPGVDC
jgi:hypothetical protein